MAYTKPNTYTDGDVLSESTHRPNEEAVRDYINSGAITTDLAVGGFDTQDIQVGELQPITNYFSAPTSDTTGAWNGTDNVSRSYFTSNIKAGKQTDNTLFVDADIYETGSKLTLTDDAEVIIHFGATFISEENDIEANGWWDSRIRLVYRNLDGSQVSMNGQTKSYSFEEVDIEVGAVATLSQGNKNPFGNTPTPTLLVHENTELKHSLRRWVGYCAHLSLPAGTYLFNVVINPKVQKGYSSARIHTTEVFYK